MQVEHMTCEVMLMAAGYGFYQVHFSISIFSMPELFHQIHQRTRKSPTSDLVRISFHYSSAFVRYMRPYQHLLIHALSFVAHCSHISHYDVRHIMSIYVLPRPPDAVEFKRELSCKECSVSPRAALNGSAWIKV